MRRTTSCLALLGALAAAPGALLAQELCGGLLTTPASGAYAEYQLTQGANGRQQVRFAIVGGEDRGGTHNVWFENRVAADGKPPVVSQVLVPGFPYAPSAVAAAALQPAAGPPIRLNAQQLSRLRQGLPGLLKAIVDGCRSSTLVGTETLKVGSRSVRATHYRNALRGSDIWVSSEVPFGIVKLTDGTDHSSMQLTATGTGAESSFRNGTRGNGT
ncbi:MAG TPA: hypothetical protein VFK36_14255 [Gemmatimonadales bacterium]|nr:hypothetical protein [Gemmatimonadales bacterium]